MGLREVLAYSHSWRPLIGSQGPGIGCQGKQEAASFGRSMVEDLETTGTDPRELAPVDYPR